MIRDLKKDSIGGIVTHTMQRIARISDDTWFIRLGEWIERDMMDKIFTNPATNQAEDPKTGPVG